MRKLVLLMVMMSLSGCYVAPASYGPTPYYGGYAPYYGTAYAPTYLGVSVVGGGYYRSYPSQHIHSGYNNGYWHNQAHAAGRPGGGGRPAGGGHGGGDRR